MGDFHSHHTSWGASTGNQRGNIPTAWAELNNLNLHTNYQDFTFRRGEVRLTLDLCFTNINTRFTSNKDLHYPWRSLRPSR